LAGTGEAGATVVLTDGNGNAIGQTTVGVNGQWSFTPAAPLANGTVVNAVAVDAIGNTSTATAVTVDAVAPVVPTIDPSNGIAITGSSLHVYNGGAEVTRQIDLVRAALTTGTPVFGSCWGIQVIAAAAGGSVRKNPQGREIGFGRGIRLTEAGRKHPMYVGKLDVFNAPTVHLDEIETLPPGTTVLASNAMSAVQAAEIRTNGSIAWAVQYHPEYPLCELAAIVRRIGTRLIDEGFFADEKEVLEFARDLDALDRDPGCKRLSWRHGISKNVLDKRLRVSEVANWVEYQVLPTRVKRGRG
jgi:GMP synthase (glutamine-hydrolysing)